MLKLKEIYQYKREIKKKNSILRPKYPFYVRKLLSRAKGIPPLSNDCLFNFYVKYSKTNIFVTITNLKGKIEFNKSCGDMGFHGRKSRLSKLAFRSILSYAIKSVKRRGLKKVFLILNAFARKKRGKVLKLFQDFNLKVVGIRDLTSNPHNGCRPKKIRRL